jgi:hypothetical protein
MLLKYFSIKHWVMPIAVSMPEVAALSRRDPRL